MMGARGALRALLGVVVLITGAWTQSEETKLAVGSEVTLVPRYSGDPSEINWKVNDNKFVDFELKPSPYKRFYRHEERSTLDDSNGRLTIRNLVKEDSGHYKAEVMVHNIIQETNIRLIVLDCPSRPVITNRSTEEMMIEVHCESSSQDVTYEWRNNSHVVSMQRLYRFNVSQLKETVNLTCEVNNGACKNSSSITFKPTEIIGPSIGIIVGIVVALLISIIAVALYILYKRYPAFFVCPCVSSSKGKTGPENGEPEQRPLNQNTEGGAEQKKDVEMGGIPAVNAKTKGKTGPENGETEQQPLNHTEG